MTAVDAESTPRLRRGVRLSYDRTRDATVLLFPEGVLVLNETAVEVLRCCDGNRRIGDIALALSERYRDVEVDDVAALLRGLAERHLVEVGTGG